MINVTDLTAADQDRLAAQLIADWTRYTDRKVINRLDAFTCLDRVTDGFNLCVRLDGRKIDVDVATDDRKAFEARILAVAQAMPQVTDTIVDDDDDDNTLACGTTINPACRCAIVAATDCECGAY